MKRYRAIFGKKSKNYREVKNFEKSLNNSSSPVYSVFAHGIGGITVVRVPGRLDVMGGIADYCGSVVCEATLNPAVIVGLQRRKDKQIYILSLGIEKEGLKNTFAMPMQSFFHNSRLINYNSAAKYFKREASTRWAAYIAGALHVLLKEKVVGTFQSGFNIVLDSTIPLGVGIGSSAAIEVGIMYALNCKLGLKLQGTEIARLCQLVENKIVGAPCGIMDQFVTTLGQQDALLAIKCQPGEVLGTVNLPQGYSVAGINSRVKHSVRGDKYRDTRIGAFMGHKIIINYLNIKPQHDPFNGYLCNITPQQYRDKFYNILPPKKFGANFLQEHSGTIDTVTHVDPQKRYRVRSRTEHPIYENHRVLQFINLLKKARNARPEIFVKKAGQLMYASHWSYRHRCGLDSPETNLLVSLAKAIGSKGGIYGAKITGGGAGGTVALFGRTDTLTENLSLIGAQYEAKTGIIPDIFLGSSPGALAFGHIYYAAVEES